MKVLLFIDSLGTGGAQRQIVNLAIGLKNNGHIPMIVGYHDINYFGNDLEANGLTYNVINRSGIKDVFFVRSLIQYIRSENIEVMVAFLFTPSFYALTIKTIIPSLKVIVSERSFEDRATNSNRILRSILYRKADAITANSYSQYLVLNSKFPKLRDRLYYIPNGVLSFPEVSHSAGDTFSFVSVGRVSDLKNTKFIISALGLFKKMHPDVHFEMKWIGSFHDSLDKGGAYFDECSKMLEECDLVKNWHWIGQVSDVDMYYSSADLLIHMSKGEGFPNAICEAMSFGIPVIASNVFDHPSIIENENDGYLVDLGDLNQLVFVINHFVNLSSNERCNMSMKARANAKESFSLMRMSKSYVNLFDTDK